MKLVQFKSNTEALRSAYVQSYNRLFRYGCSIERNPELVHDVIQDLFLWFLEHPDKIAGIENWDMYLMRCVRRNVSSAAQSQQKKKNLNKAYQLEQPDTQQSLERLLVELESKEYTTQNLADSIKKLSSHQQEVIYLRFYECLSYDEMSGILGVGNQVVRNAVSRALKNLRKHFFNHVVPAILALVSFL